MTNRITSVQNAQFKQWRKLHQAKYRKRLQTYLIEGEHLVEEALKHLPEAAFEALIISENYRGELIAEDKVDYIITQSMSDQLSQTPANQGVFAVLKMPLSDSLPQDGTHYLLIDNVQDPGNVGTMIRTADAFNYDAVILGEGSVDIYNDKVLRATQGSIWHLPVLTQNLRDSIKILKHKNIPILATTLNEQAVSYQSLDSINACAIIMGNEGQGVSSELIKFADQSVYIPMPGQSESLNVAVATGILLSKFVNN